MGNILKIDNFSNEFKSKYGLESNGNCYIVKDPFYVEVITFYKKEYSDEIPKLIPSWTRIKAEKDDLISITNSGCYIEIKGYTGYLECRPEIISKKGSPSFDKFPEQKLEMIGKNLLKCNPMTFEERKNVSIARI